MVRRLVRWNVETDTGEQVRLRYRYTVAIINKPSQIEIIKGRFLNHLAPVDDFNEICEHSIPHSDGLHRIVFSFSSDSVIRDLGEIYEWPADIRHDRSLSEKDEIAIIPYLERLTLRS